MHGSSGRQRTRTVITQHSWRQPHRPPRCMQGTGEERNEEAAAASEGGNGNGRQLVMPEDGYEWRKYGQKFIKNIQKNRSYFRCRHKLCGAKKKVEWLPQDPSGDLRIVYDGAHQHGDDPPLSSAQGAGAGAGTCGGGGANHYELGAQYFGARVPPH